MNIDRSGREFDLDEYLSLPLMAHLATGSLNGPRESPVWFLWEYDAIWLVGSSHDSFPKRIANEPRCALGFVDFNVSAGVLRHVGMRGRATIVPLDDQRLYRLLTRYLGPDRTVWNLEFKRTVIERLSLMIRFEPHSVVMRDRSYFK